MGRDNTNINTADMTGFMNLMKYPLKALLCCSSKYQEQNTSELIDWQVETGERSMVALPD